MREIGLLLIITAVGTHSVDPVPLKGNVYCNVVVSGGKCVRDEENKSNYCDKFERFGMRDCSEGNLALMSQTYLGMRDSLNSWLNINLPEDLATLFAEAPQHTRILAEPQAGGDDKILLELIKLYKAIPGIEKIFVPHLTIVADNTKLIEGFHRLLNSYKCGHSKIGGAKKSNEERRSRAKRIEGIVQEMTAIGVDKEEEDNDLLGNLVDIVLEQFPEGANLLGEADVLKALAMAISYPIASLQLRDLLKRKFPPLESLEKCPQPRIDAAAYCKAMMGGRCGSNGYCWSFVSEITLTFTSAPDRTPSCTVEHLARVQDTYSVLRQGELEKLLPEEFLEGLDEIKGYSSYNDANFNDLEAEQLEALVQLYVLSPGIEKWLKPSFTTQEGTEGGIPETALAEWLCLFKSAVYSENKKEPAWERLTRRNIQIHTWFDNFARAFLIWFEWWPKFIGKFTEKLRQKISAVITAKQPSAGPGSLIVEADVKQLQELIKSIENGPMKYPSNTQIDEIKAQLALMSDSKETTGQDDDEKYMRLANSWFDTYFISTLKFIANTISTKNIKAMKQTKLLVVPKQNERKPILSMLSSLFTMEVATSATPADDAEKCTSQLLK